MAFATTFHDLLDPLTGDRRSIRVEDGRPLPAGTPTPSGVGRDIDGSDWWVLPGLYDADAHLPLVELGLRESDRYAALQGGVTRINVALQWQDIAELDLRELVADLTRWSLPEITPILSVHSDSDASGFGPWLAENAELVRELLPPVCKLYSYGDGFWDNLRTVADAGLLPVVYCKDAEDLEAVAAKAPVPIHFRHAVSAETVEVMERLVGATLQTSPHFLLPVTDDVRAGLFVLPPVGGDDQREAFAPLVPDHISYLVTDHNAPPLEAPTGPGLQVIQHFAPAVLTIAELYGWPLPDVWEMVTTAPARRFGVELADSFVIVDPAHRQTVGLWEPRQTADRAPYAGLELTGRVIAVGNDAVVEIL